MDVAVFRRPLCTVSRAWYPACVECCVSVSRIAQLRRSLVLLIDALLQIMVSTRQRTSTPVQQVQYVWQEQPAPETPMPEAPLIRVRETFDLSSTNVEHFLDSKADLKALIPNSSTGALQEHAGSTCFVESRETARVSPTHEMEGRPLQFLCNLVECPLPSGTFVDPCCRCVYDCLREHL